MTLFAVTGPWFLAVARADSPEHAIDVAAEGPPRGEVGWGEVGWSELGHARADIHAELLEPDGPAALLASHTG